MDLSYVITPFLAWLVAGILKFTINSIRSGKLAFGLIGYGGLPSNHTAIVCSMAALIGLKVGLSHPAFGVAVTLAFIVILDASSLRKQVGQQAIAINKLSAKDQTHKALRERIGHTRVEIVAGAITGVLIAYIVQIYFP
jgi:uncharacterized protein